MINTEVASLFMQVQALNCAGVGSADVLTIPPPVHGYIRENLRGRDVRCGQFLLSLLFTVTQCSSCFRLVLEWMYAQKKCGYYHTHGRNADMYKIELTRSGVKVVSVWPQQPVRCTEKSEMCGKLNVVLVSVS
ncbi:hypothetical protein TNIN_423961 [Trichonephila inaurata madagascariensis]|uniref:Uncharacterized protein n=1 Tax=Trichonephila inaurata madagascariensis TaxID=2747483 RepID=A0A8X6XA17_9ARAC|nr:hypothetical protein TNIN_423961 [Trichonephila inaurata madagascariensis]